MVSKETALNLIAEVISEFNETQGEERRIEFSPEARLLGAGSPLSSIELVTLLVDLEGRLEAHGVGGVLTSERALSQKRSPFRDVNSLAEFICSLEEGGRGG